MKIRQGNVDDIEQIKNLAIYEWTQFKDVLTDENWAKLYNFLIDVNTYSELLKNSHCYICEIEMNKIIGFGFLVPSGNPTEIYNENQAYIRFITASKKYSGQQIGQKLTEKCIEKAKENGEKYIALHTSEMMNAARYIYEKLGFKIIKELESRLGKKYWLYELKL